MFMEFALVVSSEAALKTNVVVWKRIECNRDKLKIQTRSVETLICASVVNNSDIKSATDSPSFKHAHIIKRCVRSLVVVFQRWFVCVFVDVPQPALKMETN